MERIYLGASRLYIWFKEVVSGSDLFRKYVSWAGSIFIKVLFVSYQILYIGLHTNQGTKNYWILLVKKI